MDKIASLLKNTKRIVSRQEEIKKLRGENYNIFSILKMESKENETHSAFLGDLLNPKGSHLFGTVFLELFLETVDYAGELDINKSELILEKSIGSRDDIAKTGGRIDIYISETNGHSICIENKIYAIDQEAQIQRYVNHNKEKNYVFYLTLNGEEPTKKSKGDLVVEEEYHCISYSITIVTWLSKCLKEAAEHPILRETIKQYILLIKKLTNQLSDSKMEKEIKDLIIREYVAAKTIESNVGKIELEQTNLFLNEVKSKIEAALKEDWSIDIHEDLTQAWSGMKVSHKSWNGIKVKLEGYSKIPWNLSGYGVSASKKYWNRESILNECNDISLLKEGFKELQHWPFYKSGVLDLSSTEKRARLFNDSERKLMVQEIAQLMIDLALACEIPLSKCSKK